MIYQVVYTFEARTEHEAQEKVSAGVAQDEGSRELYKLLPDGSLYPVEDDGNE